MQSAINSKFAVGLALGIGRIVPPRAGRRLANFVADRITRRRHDRMVQAVRANQWVVSGEKLSARELDEAVQGTFRHTAYCLYNLYHYLEKPAAMQVFVEYSPHVEAIIERTRQSSDPLIVVGLHLSNFDLMIRAAMLRGLKALALAMSRSNETSGYEWQNRLRQQAGLEILPASMASLRTAVKRLEEGGTVVTGMDRPLPGSKYHPRFFGREAELPVMHIHLALATGVPVIVVAATMGPDGKYRINASEEIHMTPHPVKREAILQNAELTLEVAEELIRQAPQQWSMFYPVWPEVIESMP
jgi:KDO2-lipid IV(A) lauroyltransferase